ncbi:MAG TPA: amidophosphoribosyltransferase [Alphaproteobacteria bacterium]|jgi:amidophosphoribosyltransferase
MITTHPFDDDHLHEECGIFGVYGHRDAAALTALGMHALQHRGQEACGIVSYDGRTFHTHRAIGLVGDNFGDEAVIARLPGMTAIGHNRYSTTGATVMRNVQPLFADFESGGFAIGHNGNLTNARRLRRELVRRGCLFQSTTDTEVIIHLAATSPLGSVTDRMIDALHQVEGAYALVALTNEAMIGVRDAMGVRPLVLGHLDGAWILSSETCALDIINAKFVREVEPGEVIVIGQDGLKTLKPFVAKSPRSCIFEYVYFARPDSAADGRSVYESRRRIGVELAREAPVAADAVVPVPDSGVPAALGYAQESRIPYALGIIRNHYVGRTFIEPTERIRHLGVRLKHNPNRSIIAGKRIVLVDDSIVRGTTSTKIVEMIRQAGATEVHMRIASPPTTNSCFYGVDTPERSALLAATHSLEEMARVIGVDSLAFVSIDGLYRAMGEARRDPIQPQFCDACFSGDYPIPLIDQQEGDTSRQLSLFHQLA